MEDLERLFNQVQIRKKLIAMIQEEGFQSAYPKERIDELVDQKLRNNKEKYPEKYKAYTKKSEHVATPKLKVPIPATPKAKVKASETIVKKKNEPKKKENSKRWIAIFASLISVFLVGFFFWPDGGETVYIVEGVPYQYELYAIDKDNCDTNRVTLNELEFGDKVYVKDKSCYANSIIFSEGIFSKSYFQIHESLVVSKDEWEVYRGLFDDDFEGKKKMDAHFAKVFIDYCQKKGYTPQKGWKVNEIKEYGKDPALNISFGSFSSNSTYTNALRKGNSQYANEYAIGLVSGQEGRLIILKTNEFGKNTKILEDYDISNLKDFVFETREVNRNSYVKEKSSGNSYLYFSKPSDPSANFYIGYFTKYGSFELEERDALSGIYEVIVGGEVKEKIEIQIEKGSYAIRSEKWSGIGTFNASKTEFNGTWVYNNRRIRGQHVGKSVSPGYFEVTVVVEGNEAAATKVLWRKR